MFNMSVLVPQQGQAAIHKCGAFEVAPRATSLEDHVTFMVVERRKKRRHVSCHHNVLTNSLL